MVHFFYNMAELQNTQRYVIVVVTKAMNEATIIGYCVKYEKKFGQKTQREESIEVNLKFRNSIFHSYGPVESQTL